jgi:hypothetical protein
MFRLRSAIFLRNMTGLPRPLPNPINPAGQYEILDDGVDTAGEDVREGDSPEDRVINMGVHAAKVVGWVREIWEVAVGVVARNVEVARRGRRREVDTPGQLPELIAQLFKLKERGREDHRILDGQSPHRGADHERLKFNAAEGEDRRAGDVHAADRERQDQIGLKLDIH